MVEGVAFSSAKFITKGSTDSQCELQRNKTQDWKPNYFQKFLGINFLNCIKRTFEKFAQHSVLTLICSRKSQDM